MRKIRLPLATILGIAVVVFAVFCIFRLNSQPGTLEIVFRGCQADASGGNLAWFTLVNNNPWPIRLFLSEPLPTPIQHLGSRLIRPSPQWILGVRSQVGFAITTPTHAASWRQNIMYENGSLQARIRGNLWQRFMNRHLKTPPFEIRDMREFLAVVEISDTASPVGSPRSPRVQSVTVSVRDGEPAPWRTVASMGSTPHLRRLPPFPPLDWHTNAYLGNYGHGRVLYQTESNNR
jgi:hypothetical protein